MSEFGFPNLFDDGDDVLSGWMDNSATWQTPSPRLGGVATSSPSPFLSLASPRDDPPFCSSDPPLPSLGFSPPSSAQHPSAVDDVLTLDSLSFETLLAHNRFPPAGGSEGFGFGEDDHVFPPAPFQPSHMAKPLPPPSASLRTSKSSSKSSVSPQQFFTHSSSTSSAQPKSSSRDHHSPKKKSHGSSKSSRDSSRSSSSSKKSLALNTGLSRGGDPQISPRGLSGSGHLQVSPRSLQISPRGQSSSSPLISSPEPISPQDISDDLTSPVRSIEDSLMHPRHPLHPNHHLTKSQAQAAGSSSLKRQRTSKQPAEDYWKEKFEAYERLVTDQDAILKRVAGSLESLDGALRTSKEEQRQAILQSRLDLAASGEQYAKIRHQLEVIDTQLTHLNDDTILPPSQLVEVKEAHSHAKVLIAQVSVLMNELSEESFSESLMQLVWVSQPFPALFAKHLRQQLDPNRLTLQLITSASVSVINTSPVSIHVLRDGELILNDDNPPTEGNVQRLNNSDFKVSFPLRFVNGTNKRVAQMKASVELSARTNRSHGNAEFHTLRSIPSDPFIITVHPKQFTDAGGLLLLSTLFYSKATLPTWPALANALQAQFLNITRQDFVNPQRGLSPGDLSYIHERFFRKQPTCTAEQFQEFWLWYGPVLKQIKYSRHINNLWQAGAILGFFSRQELEYILGSQLPGTFLVRFSER
ncbi:MAG: hypothetical protein Q8P67_02430, partial [archaeon]|nr:hypothetical protein [archaeon]